MYYRGNGNGDSELAPGLLMATLNYQLFRSTPPEKYATMFLGCYDAASRSLTYSNAGHLPPLVLGSNGQVRRLETSGTVVGLFDGMSYDESTIGMEPGDIFVAYSDGITEPENEFGEFGEERLIELIQRHRDQPLARISEIVTGAVTDWIAGGEQPDDVTLVLARRGNSLSGERPLTPRLAWAESGIPRRARSAGVADATGPSRCTCAAAR